jgi:adenylate cyclase
LSKTELKLVVLYADVSGSTRLYETFGDKIAKADVRICLDLLTEVAEKYDGKKLKEIGDEVMCTFDRPDKAAEAAIEMNQALQEAREEDRFESGAIHVKMGWHYGGGTFRGDDIIGPAPMIAQQVINMANRDEILTTQTCIDELPAMIKCTANFIDRVEAEDGSGSINVFALPWDEDDDGATVVTSSQEVTAETAHGSLVLHYRDKQIEMSPKNTHCRVGRGEDNDLTVYGNFTSRHHGELYYRHGRFHVSDMSTNGTGIAQEGDDYVLLHREEKILHGTGIISFGGKLDADPEASVKYECIRTNNQ